MAVENRLSAEPLDALAPGDPVTIEFVRDFRRPKQVAGTVVRFVGSQIFVSCRSDCCVPYVHRFDRRGIRVGGGGYAELVELLRPSLPRTSGGARSRASTPPTANGRETGTTSTGCTASATPSTTVWTGTSPQRDSRRADPPTQPQQQRAGAS